MRVKDPSKHTALGASVVLWLVAAAPLPAEITITLKESFINRNMHRVTLEPTLFTVDAVKKAINPASEDGDLHIAGRSDDVKLPMVAEIMNAKSRTDMFSFVTGKKGQKIRLAGAWRLWCENGGSGAQTQGQPFTVTPGQSNPDHVFEIHPITAIETNNLVPTLTKVVG